MRRAVPVLLLVALPLLAGCTQPADEKKEDPLFGLCPQWAHGPGGTTGNLVLGADGHAQRELGPAAERYLDRPLDLFRVAITQADVDGVLELRAVAADGEGLSIRDYRGKEGLVPVVDVDSAAAGHEFDVYLSAVLQDAPPAKVPAFLNWTLDGASAAVQYNITYHYKVCGA